MPALEDWVREDLHQAMPGTSGTQINKVLAQHCGSRRYLEALAAGGPRYAWDGTPSGAVSRNTAPPPCWSWLGERRRPRQPAGQARSGLEARYPLRHFGGADDYITGAGMAGPL